MGRKKRLAVGKVISVRVTDEDMEIFQRLVALTGKSASQIMRDAILTILADVPRPDQSGGYPFGRGHGTLHQHL